MRTSSKTLLYVSFFFLFINSSIAQNLTSDVDALISEKYAKDGPGISLLIAALSAKGTSIINNIEQIDRGYEDIENRLRSIGAKIERVND